MIRVARWSARVLGALVVVLCVTYFAQAGAAAYPLRTTRDAIGFIALGACLAGMIVAWWWEGVGGALILGGYLVNVAASRGALASRAFLAIPVAGALFLLVWWARRPEPRAAAGGAVRSGRLRADWVRRGAFVAAFVLVALIASEVVLPTPLGLGDSPLPARVTGRWEARGKVVNSWGPPGEIAFVFIVDAGGSVEGTIGASVLHGARLVRNRTWFGRALHLRSDYLLKGPLRDPITPSLGLTCATFALPLDVNGGLLEGALTGSNCRAQDAAQGALRSAHLTFRKAATAKR
ncbi:MAG TPA: hypothetical protein VMT19_02675 [Thermoanaerobaculaceae bacterium]|nr:hypothetical protein [Thermoanaerobaculaceae bacterium]